jgi:hypothetical protein
MKRIRNTDEVVYLDDSGVNVVSFYIYNVVRKNAITDFTAVSKS